MILKLKSWIYLIFTIALLFNLYFSFLTPNYSDSNAYFNLRQIDSIKEDFKPLHEDNLSFGGRTLLFSPAFHYILAIFSFILGDSMLKIIPALLISSLVLLTYNLVKEITKDKTAILFSTIMSAFIPILISETLNKISVYSLNLVLIFLLLVSFMRIKDKKHLKYFVILSFLLPLTHPISFLLAITFILYLIIAYSEGIRVTKLKKEAITFYIFITLLINFLIYKQAFLSSGLSLIRQNIPFQILNNYFLGLNLIELIIAVGIIPIIFGMAGISFGLFRNKNEPTILFSSLILTTLALMALKLIGFDIALIFIGLALVITSALGLDKFHKYLNITKLSKFDKYIKAFVLILIILTLVIPSYRNANNVISNTISQEEIEALNFLNSDTKKEDVIISTIDEGHYITQIAKRKNYMDNNFLLIEDVNPRSENLNELFQLHSVSKAANIMRENDITYIYFSNNAKELYKIEDLPYTKDQICFRRSFNNEKVTIYRLRC